MSQSQTPPGPDIPFHPEAASQVAPVQLATDRLVLVTGATGYIGGRLVPRLLEAGWNVRCLVRDPRKLADRVWCTDPRVELARGDSSDPEAVAAAMKGCKHAYYLIHSMLASGADYADKDRRMAQIFTQQADKAGLQRLVYLGGLGEMGDDLSEHLTSRREVEKILKSGKTPVTVLRAAMIIGSGSASFEILRYLVERLPVMVTPKWVSTECQPIAVRNVLHYLVTCISVAETAGKTLDIGGADVLPYRDLMQVMAEELGLKRRLIVPVPVLTPWLSSWWIHLVTPLSRDIARPLAEGLKNRVVCRDAEAHRLMPQKLLTARESIRLALDVVKHQGVETSWSTAGVIPGDPDWAGGKVYEDVRTAEIAATPAEVYRAVCRIGGGNGWYAADYLWRLRGFMDRLVGGPGLRRGRRNPEKVSFGEALDFWRVCGLERDKRLSLRAEMKVPGEALLQFDIESLAPLNPDVPRTKLTQTARFRPLGLAGLAYWYAVLPFHGFVFRSMLAGIQREAETHKPTETAPAKAS